VESIKEKIAYLEGMAEGLNVEDSQEGLLFREMLMVLREMTDTLEHLQSSQQEVDEYIRTIDEDLTELENEVYGEAFPEDDFVDGDDDHHLVVLDCANCGENIYLENGDLEEQELICPNCHETIYIDEDYLVAKGHDDLEYSNGYAGRKGDDY